MLKGGWPIHLRYFRIYFFTETKMALKVSSVNLYPLENAKAHNTYKFEAVHLSPPTAIFRRGQEFDLEIVFSNRSFNSQVDKLRIIFNFGALFFPPFLHY